eukprot:m.248701 g.248701  ORF g.248701 m.248701 type:complete len:89 (+) comp61770_c0_seq1:119-385(+)
MDEEQLLIEALRCDPNNFLAYLTLSIELPHFGHKTVKLSDGRVMNSKQLSMEAMRCSPVAFSAMQQGPATIFYLSDKPQSRHQAGRGK